MVATRERSAGPAPGSSPPPPPASPTPAKRPRRAERLAYLVLAVLAVAIIFFNDWGAFYPDNKPELYLAPSRTLGETFSTWLESPKQAGFPNFNIGLAPVALLTTSLDAIGLPPWVIVRVWRSGLVLLAGWGMVRFLRRVWPPGDDGVRPGAQALGRVVAVVVYVANPFTILQGGTGAVLLPHALLPWLLLCFANAVAAAAPSSDQDGGAVRRRGWRWQWPARFALVFFAMTGMNAGVIPLFLLLSLPAWMLYARLVDRARWSAMFGVLVRCGLLTVIVSLYWLVPSLLASATGGAVAGATEDYRSVASTTSWSESLRLTGIWTLYGRAGQRLFQPPYAALLTTPAVVAATFLVPFGAALGAWWSRSLLRAFPALLLMIVLPVMVGLFPPDSPTPFGRIWDKVLTTVPGAIAFRTTNKLGSLAALALAILLALGVAQAATVLVRRSLGLQVLAACATTVVILGSMFPAWSGNLYRYSFDVPDYWRQAARVVDQGGDNSRVLVIPGGAGANYRWGGRSPDEVLPSLLDRTSVVRSTVAPPSDPAANFMLSFDEALNNGTLPPGAISVVARYLGADQVLVRNDMRWEEVDAMAPSGIMRQVGLDPGLERQASFGRPGQYTVRPDLVSDPEREADAATPPLVLYSVNDPAPVVQSASTAGTVMLDGDNAALGPLAGAGVLDGKVPFRLAGDMTSDEFVQLLDEGGRVVMTDTNRRREGGVNRVRDTSSPTLSPDAPYADGSGPTPTLFAEDVDTQTTVQLEGAASISATRHSFANGAKGKPAFAFDGDLSTSWMTGHLQTARGKKITIDWGEDRTVGAFEIVTDATTDYRIATIRVTAGDRSIDLSVDDDLVVEGAFEDVEADTFSVEILDTNGDDVGGVGIAEIQIDGVPPATEAAALPRTISRLAEAGGDGALERLAQVPFDVLFIRPQGRAVVTGDDEERRMVRTWEMPVGRTMALTASIGSVASLPPAAVNALFFGRLQGDTRANLDCQIVGRLDGQILRMQVDGTLTGLLQGTPLQLSANACQEVVLAPGAHRFEADPGWVFDTVQFSSPATVAMPAVPETTDPTVLDTSATEVAMTASETGPYWVSTGRGYDARWIGRLDGDELPAPVIVNGYATGWRIDSPGDVKIEAGFAPQGTLMVVIAVSAIGLLVTIVLARRRRTRYRPRHVTAPPVGKADEVGSR